MKSSWKGRAQAIGAIVILAVTGWLAWRLGVTAWTAFGAAGAEVKAASIAAFGSVMVLAAGRAYDRRRAIEQDLREQKVAVYTEFVGFWFEILFASKLGKPQPDDARVVERMTDFTQRLIFWGSDAVIREWGDLYQRFQSIDEEANSTELLFEFEKLLLAVRRDTGHRNWGIGRGGILRLFINDINKHL